MTSTSYCPRAHGGAWYESHSGRREFEIHVWGLKRLAGKRVTVRVHGALVGRMLVSARGGAHLDRHGGVPAMAAGNRVRVTWSGHLASSGRLRGMHHHMGM